MIVETSTKILKSKTDKQLASSTKIHKYSIRIISVLISVAYIHLFILNAHQSFDFGPIPVVMAVAIAFSCNLGLWITSIPFAIKHRVLTALLLIPTAFITPVVTGYYHEMFAIMSLILTCYVLFVIYIQR